VPAPPAPSPVPPMAPPSFADVDAILEHYASGFPLVERKVLIASLRSALAPLWPTAAARLASGPAAPAGQRWPFGTLPTAPVRKPRRR
jgi:hypothetical protein